MKKFGLKSILIKKFKYHTTKIVTVEKYNILDRYFSITTINENGEKILHIYIQLKMVGVI